jgi:hypothetical protein
MPRARAAVGREPALTGPSRVVLFSFRRDHRRDLGVCWPNGSPIKDDRAELGYFPPIKRSLRRNALAQEDYAQTAYHRLPFGQRKIGY